MKNTTPTPTAVAINKTSVSAAMDVIAEKLKAMKHIEESVYKTSGKITTGNGTLDIKTEKNIATIVTGLGSILIRAKAQDDAYEALGIATRPVTKIDGGTVEEWTADCKLRCDIINNEENVNNLKDLQKHAEELMDKDDKLALLMAKIANL